MKIVLITGGFDPLHSGHISYINEAKKLGDILIVGVNSDEWLKRKKGKSFLSLDERMLIISNLKNVDNVIKFNDNDNTAINAIQKVREIYPNSKIIFANGGDRTSENIPEMVISDDIEFVFGVGGNDKKNSSSWILKNWTKNRTNRIWGHYNVLHTPDNSVKVKELVVEPGKKLSMQRHFKRAEHWFVQEGIASVYSLDRSSDFCFLGNYTKHQSLHIDKMQWHQLCNETDQLLRIIEIQYGENCVEEDIERI